MMKITGFDNIQRQLVDARRAFQALDGNIATVKFDPDNPESIAAAVTAMEAAVDAKVSPYRGNPLIEGLVPQLKDKYRTAILKRAKAAKA